jgi:hypothetical protein
LRARASPPRERNVETLWFVLVAFMFSMYLLWERPEQVVRDLEAFMKDTRPVWSSITDPSANFREHLF